MNYKNYIVLGFERVDLSCSVTFKETGYYGFVLEKKYNRKILVSVESGELDKPKLYIKKRNSETYHIITITPEMVSDLFYNPKNNNSLYTAC
jgi:hypothetical protein